MEILTCAYCELPATLAVDELEGNCYTPVCQEDFDRLQSDFGMVEVELVTEFEPCGCGCEEY